MRSISVRSSRACNHGTSLLEVLITVFVIATGLLAASLMTARSLQTTRETQALSEATALLADMATWMTINPAGLRAGAYDDKDTAAENGADLCRDSACGPDALALADLGRWREALHGSDSAPARLPPRVDGTPALGTINAVSQSDGSLVLGLEWAELRDGELASVSVKLVVMP